VEQALQGTKGGPGVGRTMGIQAMRYTGHVASAWGIQLYRAQGMGHAHAPWGHEGHGGHGIHGGHGGIL
jgi:hypothetical protein